MANSENTKRAIWLDERRKGIGGSDAAAVVGLNPYSTRFMVWADKLGKLPEKEDTEAMRQGRDLEDYVAKRFCEAVGKKVRREKNIIKNPDYPFALANVDRMVIGEKAGLECKTTSTLNLKKFSGGEFPDNYYVQCMHYMAVTGAEKWYLAVLIYGNEFKWFEIPRDEAEIKSLMECEKEFWENYVLRGIEPPPDGEKSTTSAINSVFQGGVDESVTLFGREKMIKEYFERKDEITKLEKQNEKIKQTLMLDLGECEKGTIGNFYITYKPQERTSFDYKKFAAENPDIKIDKYMKKTKSRPFYLKEKKETEKTSTKKKRTTTLSKEEEEKISELF